MDYFSQQERRDEITSLPWKVVIRAGRSGGFILRSQTSPQTSPDQADCEWVVTAATEPATVDLEMVTSLEIRLGSSYLLSQLILQSGLVSYFEEFSLMLAGIYQEEGGITLISDNNK